jgi:hypothetical protein
MHKPFERGSRESAIEFDKEYVDEVSGFTGVATGVTVYRNGCVQALLTGKSKDGTAEPTSLWVDDTQLTEKPMKREGRGGPSTGPAPSLDRH